MDKKTKELIAIGASIASHCQPCLKYHFEQALENGASIEEIQEAISVGKTVEKGALKAMDNFAKEQMGADIKPNSTICCDDNTDCCLSKSK